MTDSGSISKINLESFCGNILEIKEIVICLFHHNTTGLWIVETTPPHYMSENYSLKTQARIMACFWE